MAIGKNKLSALSNSLLSDKISNDVINSTCGNDLYIRRNNKMIARYYYYTVLKQFKTDAVLSTLSLEFCISTKRISDVLDENTDGIKQLRKKAPGIPFFKKEWPDLSW